VLDALGIRHPAIVRVVYSLLPRGGCSRHLLRRCELRKLTSRPAPDSAPSTRSPEPQGVCSTACCRPKAGVLLMHLATSGMTGHPLFPRLVNHAGLLL
jgi:hypothetical protein